MSSIAALLWNPIVAREVRTRMRSLRTAVIVLVFLTALGLVAWSAYASATSASLAPAARGRAGVTVFAALSGVAMALLALIVPGLVGGALSSEREHQTLDLLLCTRVRPWRIVVGKLVASLIFVGFLLVAALPIIATIAILGGVEIGDVLVVAVITVATTLLLGSLAICCSAIARRTAVSIVLAYALTFLLFVVPVLFGAALSVVSITGGVTVSGGSVSTVPGITGSGIVSPPTQTVPLQPSAPQAYQRSIAIGQLVSAFSPGAALGGELSKLQTSSACTYTFTQGGVGLAPVAGSTLCTEAVSTADVVRAGPLGGWHLWMVFLLYAVGLSLVFVSLSVVILRGRVPWPVRHRNPPP